MREEAMAEKRTDYRVLTRRGVIQWAGSLDPGDSPLGLAAKFDRTYPADMPHRVEQQDVTITRGPWEPVADDGGTD
jgi:hypothetical protein